MEQLSATLYGGERLPSVTVTLVLKRDAASAETNAIYGFFLLPSGWEEVKPGGLYAARAADGRMGRFRVQRVGRKNADAAIVAVEFVGPFAPPRERQDNLADFSAFEAWLAG